MRAAGVRGRHPLPFPRVSGVAFRARRFRARLRSRSRSLNSGVASPGLADALWLPALPAGLADALWLPPASFLRPPRATFLSHRPIPLLDRLSGLAECYPKRPSKGRAARGGRRGLRGRCAVAWLRHYRRDRRSPRALAGNDLRQLRCWWRSARKSRARRGRVTRSGRWCSNTAHT